MDVQIYRLLTEDMDFDLFRSEMDHMQRNNIPKDVVYNMIQYDFVHNFWNKAWYAKALYSLAILDYWSDIYHAPRYAKYDEYRQHKLTDVLYPREVLLMDNINQNDNAKQKAVLECSHDAYGKYFFRYNIIEKGEPVCKSN